MGENSGRGGFRNASSARHFEGVESPSGVQIEPPWTGDLFFLASDFFGAQCRLYFVGTEGFNGGLNRVLRDLLNVVSERLSSSSCGTP